MSTLTVYTLDVLTLKKVTLYVSTLKVCTLCVSTRKEYILYVSVSQPNRNPPAVSTMGARSPSGEFIEGLKPNEQRQHDLPLIPLTRFVGPLVSCF